MAITNSHKLQQRLALNEYELAFTPAPGCPPLLISDKYERLLDIPAIRIQCVPDVREKEAGTETIDPLTEEAHSVTPRLIHRYGNRAAFLTTDICFSYCRHCFRRRFTGTFQGPASESEIKEAASYLEKHGEISELLLTGGDVLTLSDEQFDRMLSILRSARPDLMMRICTRAPSSKPERVTEEFVGICKKYNTAPFFLMTQFNAAEEIDEASIAACGKFVDAGIPAFNQSVLLRGVNDSAEALARLSEALLRARVKPYYVFQGDYVAGTAHLRLSLEETLAIEEKLRVLTSGLGMPVFTLDLPDGGGKIPLGREYIVGKTADGFWRIKGPDGKEHLYR